MFTLSRLSFPVVDKIRTGLRVIPRAGSVVLRVISRDVRGFFSRSFQSSATTLRVSVHARVL